MIKKYVAFAAVLVVVAAVAAPVAAQDGAGLAGAWKIVQEMRGRTTESTLTLARADDGTWSGTMADRRGTSDLEEVAYADDKLTFKRSMSTQRGDMELAYTVWLDGDQLAGKMSTPMGVREFTASRVDS